MSGIHSLQSTSEGIHIPYNWPYANAAARTGATGFVATDVGKFARQIDDNSIWLLTDTTPTWKSVSHGDFSSGGEAGGADRTLGNTDNYDLGFLTNNTNRLHIQNDGYIGVGTTTPDSKLHVDQDSASGAIPTLHLKQTDVSEEMMELETTIGVGNAIEAVGAKTLTTTHFVKVTITGVGTRYFPVGTIA